MKTYFKVKIWQNTKRIKRRCTLKHLRFSILISVDFCRFYLILQCYFVNSCLDLTKSDILRAKWVQHNVILFDPQVERSWLALILSFWHPELSTWLFTTSVKEPVRWMLSNHGSSTLKWASHKGFTYLRQTTSFFFVQTLFCFSLSYSFIFRQWLHFLQSFSLELTLMWVRSCSFSPA